jgi:DNA repair protein RadC
MPAKKMMEIKPYDRPREKIETRGVSSLKDHELIAAILGKGTKDHDIFSISRKIADMIKGEGLPSWDRLLAIDGVGPSKASILMASFELARRYGVQTISDSIRITSPEDMIKIQEVADLRRKNQEYFLCTTLNGASEVVATRIITIGLINHSLVHPREVFADAITDRAAAIICVHNHPSGNPEPSTEDLKVTKQLCEAGEILGISLLDHLIITKTGITSLKSLGHL